jgi:exodeoxyribonuclease VII large subunit
MSRMGGRMEAAAARLLDERRLRVEGLARGLPEPQRLLEIAMQRLDDRSERLDLAWRAGLRDRAARIANAAALLKHPRQQLADHARHLETVAQRLQPAALRLAEYRAERLKAVAPRLDAAIPREVERHGKDLARLGQILDSLSPFKVLERGYAVVEDRDGHPMSATTIAPGMALNLRFHDATVPVRAEDGAATASPPPPVQAKPEPAKPKPKPAEPRQTSLF